MYDIIVNNENLTIFSNYRKVNKESRFFCVDDDNDDARNYKVEISFLSVNTHSIYKTINLTVNSNKVDGLNEFYIPFDYTANNFNNGDYFVTINIEGKINNMYLGVFNV